MHGVLVIGIGHPDRGDDAVGLLVARRIATGGSIPLDVRECTGDLTSLLDTWTGAGGVVLIDATVGCGAPGTIHVRDLRQAPPPSGRPASNHGFGLAEAVALGEALGTLPIAIRLVGIEGACFDVGSAPSPAVMTAIPAAAAAARTEALRLVAALA
jgi:hydrogenase maturation protease